MGQIKELLKELDTPISNKYTNKSLYLNRELSWLEFNKRVLIQTVRKDVPLIERCNFLSITSSNMDEFIMVRLASSLNSLMKNPTNIELSGMNPHEEFKSMLNGIKRFKSLQDNCYEILLKKLNKENIHICKYKELTKDEKSYIGKIFYKSIFPVLTPINFDTTKQFPDIISKQLSIVVSLEDSSTNDLQVISFIPLNENLDLIYEIPTKNDKAKKYILLEDIIYGYLNRIYFNKKILDYGMIKILRQADIELSHDKGMYITDRMRNTLLQRRYSEPIFMDVTSNISKPLQKIIMKIFELNKSQVFEYDNTFNYGGLTKINLENGKYKSFSPQYPSELIGEHDMFTAIDNGDIVLHHPYESFDPVVKFLEHAAYDKDVIAIKQTLYRVSSIDSPIVNALCKAAENGKQVSVILEIKARFDEDRNISMIEKMKLAGIQLIYGTEDLKTHCKFIVVVRRSKKGFKVYTHLGTGNYNDKTSKIYTDLSYFTSDFKIGQDVAMIFNMLSGFSEPTTKINKLFFSPYNLRKKLENCIEDEIKNAKNGKPAIITLKVNSISDKAMIDKLYTAAKHGVKIIVFCRGICSMKPINKNIMIRSIVGRFLEHSRIYYFHNNNHPNIFISSADLLTRNLDKRFEILTPVKDEAKEKILKILSMYYKDTFNSFEMDNSGEYHKLEGECNIHDLFMKEAIENYKFKSIPKMVGLKKKD